MKRFRSPAFLALALVLALVPRLVFAQSQATTGVIEGIVLDPQGATLPGALVSLRNTATNFDQNVTTDASGKFRTVQMPLGPYVITVTLDGFATLVREGVTLMVGQTITLTLRMELSGVQQEVRVTAEAPVVETARTDGVTAFDEKEVQTLPNFNHNFMDYTMLTPGVAIVQSPDGEQITMNGQRGIFNNVSVDGADFNNPFFGEQRGGQRPPFTFNLDAVQEVTVVADGANAEFGRSAGGFVNVITRSGTNDIHGSVHGFYTSDGLSAAAPTPDGGFVTPKPEGDRYQVGFTFGGALLQDKAFYFLSGDYQNGNETKQLDPLRIQPDVVAVMAALGSPNENAPIDRSDDAFVALAKVDWRVTEANLFTLRFAYNWAEQDNGTFDVDSWGISANAIEKVFAKALSGSLLSTLSANWANEFRFQFAREDRPRPYDGAISPQTGRPFPDTAFDFARGYRFGMPFFIPVDYHDDRTQFVENLTYYRGAHTFKAGVEFNRTVASQIFRGFINGRYIFDSTEGFFAFLADPDNNQQHVLLYIQQAGVGDTTAEEAGTQAIPQEEWGVFLQDTWQPIPNLTFNIGLRWEAQIEPDLITPIPDLFYSDFIGTTQNGQEFPSEGTIPSDKNMWQPRFGVAWDPTRDGRTVVRATFGIYYARIAGLNMASARSTDGSRGQEIDRGVFGGGGPAPAYPFLLTEFPEVPNHPGVFVFDKDFQNPQTISASLGVEREIMTDLAVLLRYNYADTKHLTRFVNRNSAELNPERWVGPAPWSFGLGADGTNGLGQMTTVESTAKSRYWGITVGVNKRFTNCFGIQANYTYSEDRSDDDNERDPFTLRYARIFEDPTDPTAEFSKEYSWSDRDQRHRFNGWFLYTAPFGVQLNVVYTYQSAQPLSITATGEPAASPQARCNTTNPAFASNPCNDPEGTVTQRNLGRKDNSLSKFDLRLARAFNFSGFIVEPIVDIFNVFNADNFLVPQTTNLVFNFDGTVRSGAGEPRRFQFGLRLAW
jgi:hypothetical protein